MKSDKWFVLFLKAMVLIFLALAVIGFVTGRGFWPMPLFVAPLVLICARVTEATAEEGGKS